MHAPIRRFVVATCLLASCADEQGGRDGDDARDGAILGRWLMPPDISAVSRNVHVEIDGSPPGKHVSSNCTGSFTPGARVVADYLADEFAGILGIGGYVCRPIDHDPSKPTSVHGLGRALDIFVTCESCAADNVTGDPIAHWLIEHAEAIGIQRIIWDESSWKGVGLEQTNAYGGGHRHNNHLHVELTIDAANMQTPWFEQEGFDIPPDIPEPPDPDDPTPTDPDDPDPEEPEEDPPLPDRAFHLRYATSTGPADVVFHFGEGGDTAVMGDWDGDGVDTPGLFRDGRWYLRNTNTTGGGEIELEFGDPGDVPVVGDWDGDGIDTVGVFRRGVWYLRDANTTGSAAVEFWFGADGDEPVVGDWDGDGVDTPGVYRDGQWFMRNANSGGPNDVELWFGDTGDFAVVGDWNGDGLDTPGVYRDGQWFLRNGNASGPVDVELWFGDPGDRAIVGDFTGGGRSTVGISRDV
jgi:hypothetical protein